MLMVGKELIIPHMLTVGKELIIPPMLMVDKELIMPQYRDRKWRKLAQF